VAEAFGYTSPALIAAAGESAKLRFIEFFTANIRNRNTRRAYAQAVSEFLAWCEHRSVPSITAVQPVHVAGYVEELTRARSAPTAKQRLSAIRHLFDWLVVGQVMPANPAASVRGPSHVVKRGKTPVLSPEEARRVLDAIDVSTHAGLRDRALIALMVFSFACIGAALTMKVEDVFVQNRRLWVRLREKGGKRHEMPCHHNLETYLHAYLDGSGIAADPKGALFRTIGRTTGQLTTTPLPQANAHAMIRRRAGRCWHQDPGRQSHLPGNWHHSVPEERRLARKRGRHGEPRLDPYHAALRSPARRGEPR
jgi:site-specific recombinase XerD